LSAGIPPSPAASDAQLPLFHGLLPSLLRYARTSLSPRTVRDAYVVSAQLDMVRANARLLHYTLPLAGGVIVFLANIPPGLVEAWWAALCLLCIANEAILSRRPDPNGDVIAQTRMRARIMALLAIVLTLVWASHIWLNWQPGADHRISHLANLFVLACSLGVVSTFLSLHAATALAPILTLSVALIAAPALEDARRNDMVISIGLLYVFLMLGQANASHRRVKRMLLLEHERITLIEALHKAKIESDDARHEAESASRAKSAFLANMSHELRTPLNAIIGFSDLLRGKAAAGGVERFREYGGFIHDAGRSLLGLINHILEMANIDAGRRTLVPELLDMGAVVTSAVEAERERAQTRGIALSCDVARELPLLYADRGAVRQILRNLLSNALKFTLASGSVHVSVRAGADRMVLTVRDTGAGITPEERPFVFDRFGRRGGQTADGARGIGLGLPLVKALVEMHHGAVTLDSDVARGTVVTVSLPIAADRPQRAATA
jgi:two-component system cell cycle sensor histidine kinase PleC